MKARFQVIKGAPSWRSSQFWVVLAIFGAQVSWALWRGDPLWPTLICSLLYAMMLLPHRLFLGKQWLFCFGPVFSAWRQHRFERIESYYILSSGDAKDATVMLTLLSFEARKPQTVFITIQNGVELAAFHTAMTQLGVRNPQEDLDNSATTWKILHEVFSPPFPNIEAEREALYQLLGRPMPKI